MQLFEVGSIKKSLHNMLKTVTFKDSFWYQVFKNKMRKKMFKALGLSQCLKFGKMINFFLDSLSSQ